MGLGQSGPHRGYRLWVRSAAGWLALNCFLLTLERSLERRIILLYLKYESGNLGIALGGQPLDFTDNF
jgi:hypothetical protein